MTLPQFRVRTLLIIVAVVACAFGGYAALQRRSAALYARAQRHAMLSVLSKGPYSERYHQDMTEKYRRASLYPWLPVSPDPPPPE